MPQGKRGDSQSQMQMLAFTVEPLQAEKRSPKCPCRANNDEPGIVGVSAFKTARKANRNKSRLVIIFNKKTSSFSAENKNGINHPGEDEQS